MGETDSNSKGQKTIQEYQQELADSQKGKDVKKKMKFILVLIFAYKAL